MATITRVSRQSGYAYKVLVRLRGIKPFSKTFKRRADDAKAWAERMERDIDQARAHGSAAQLTLCELIKECVNHWTGRAKGTSSVLTWWKQEYGNRKITEVDAQVIREALKALETEEIRVSNGKGKSKVGKWHKRAPATLNRYKAVLSGVFEYGRERLDLPDNPCRQVKAYPVDNARIRFLSDEEQAALLAQCKQSEWQLLYLLVLLAITTGARLGELLRLRWRDIKIKERRAYVTQTKNGEPRALPLVDSVIEELNKQRDVAIEERCKQLDPGVEELLPLEPNTLIFESKREPGKPVEFRKHWDKAVNAAEITDFRFHDLRHTCASILAQNGATLLQIADVLGHRQLEVTKRYAHLCIDHKQALVDQGVITESGV